MYAVGRKLSCVCRAVCERDRERVTCVLILHTHRSSRWPPSGRQIFENVCALRAQANFQSNFRKHGPAPNQHQQQHPNTGGTHRTPHAHPNAASLIDVHRCIHSYTPTVYHLLLHAERDHDTPSASSRAISASLRGDVFLAFRSTSLSARALYRWR